MSDDPSRVLSAPPLSRCAAAAAVFAGLAGAGGVALGAWASHGLAEPAKGWVATASTYQMIHALALLAAAVLHERLVGWPRRLAGAGLAAFAAGIVLFCGALVALAVGSNWGPAAPAGGMALMAGWAALAAAGLAGLLRRPG